jgi:drug/metabolite transporter (DMT)-like permease
MRTSLWLLVLGSTLGWACLDFARKLLADRLSPRVALLWMTTLSCPLFLAWAALAAPPSRWITAPEYFAPAIASVAINVVANLLYFRALQLAPFSQTLPMLSLTPVFATASAMVLLGETPTPRRWLGAVVVVVGAVILQAGPGGLLAAARAIRHQRGAQMMAAVALLWSICTTLDKAAVRHSAPPFHGAFLNGGVALAVFLSLLGHGGLARAGRARHALWPLLGALVVGALALGLQLVAIREVPVGWLETVKRGVGGFAAVLLGAALLAEPINSRKVGAVAVMTLGVALLVL